MTLWLSPFAGLLQSAPGHGPATGLINCLISEGLCTEEAIRERAKQPYGLERIPNVGKKSVARIKWALAQPSATSPEPPSAVIDPTNVSGRTLGEHRLTPNEERELLKYLKFLRIQAELSD